MRQKIISLITIEVHARDIVAKLAEERADSVDSFGWQSQLRYYWDTTQHQVVVKIVDATFNYCWEYHGNR